MARGNSGRVVIEIAPQLKRRLHAKLALDGLTMKDWFVLRACEYLDLENRRDVEYSGETNSSQSHLEQGEYEVTKR